MLIREVIDRADALLNNEYTDEEKYHWCDVVSAELLAVPARRYKTAVLKRCADNTFLLPQDCEFERIEKIVIDRYELEKQDFRTYNIYQFQKGYVFLPKKWVKYIDGGEVRIVYLPVNVPIRRIELKDEEITIDIQSGTITMSGECPFIAGDVIEVESEEKTFYIKTGSTIEGETTIGGKQTVNVMYREAVLDDDGKTMTYVLTLGGKEAFSIGTSGRAVVDMKRVITDRTVCEAPYDEMYIDYLCAQICFYQRKHDVYQQHIARYNARMEEYAKFVKDFAAQNDHTVFRNWWKL